MNGVEDKSTKWRDTGNDVKSASNSACSSVFERIAEKSAANLAITARFTPKLGNLLHKMHDKDE
ncbi:hypothetical protein [Paenibacillus alginolyticus]|uniref:hypothetical protein n=1 Tax=Paenibacillus alginolyticus TaxID=59839 RepID=UPI0015636B14|nr:hypothetical protein [Paenibacillus frigoriresistens]